MIRKIYNKICLRKLRRHFEESAKINNIKTIQFFLGGNILLLFGSTKEDIEIGDNCLIYGLLVSSNGGKIKFGKYAQIGNGSMIRCVERIEIGDYTAIANNVIIQDNNNHPVNPHDRFLMQHTPPGSKERGWINSAHKPIKIGKNCWIGENSRICKGVTIGDGSIVGANSVVTKPVPDNCIVVGNPARIVKTDIDKTTPRVFKDSDFPSYK